MKKKFNLDVTRRQVLKAGLYGGAAMMLPWKFIPSIAYAGSPFLSNPATVDKFSVGVPDAMDPGFMYEPVGMRAGNPHYQLAISQGEQSWGQRIGIDQITPIFGYGGTWPGKTFEVQSGKPVQVQWRNELGNQHLLPVDPNLHWCYSLHGYDTRSIANDGVPVVTHLHGGHTAYLFDGNPEQFYSPNWRVKGPRWRGRTNVYQNDQPAGNLWYHDHALGITRLNVYAGMAGFYFVRDDMDTGQADNPLGLPAHPYEKAYAIQDRMFRSTGELFYPAYPGDPAYDDFIETALPVEFFPENPNNEPGDGGGPTALAEFFGDHMVVNGKAWPKEDVERRNYRLHLLNGCDSRFLIIQFVTANEADNEDPSSNKLDFYVVGSDQGLGRASGDPETIDELVVEPGGRYDIVVDFSQVPVGSRVIMKNIGGDEPFGGTPGPQIFAYTDRIMAFDVEAAGDSPAFDASAIPVYEGVGPEDTTRRVALFEGMDEFERLQPLLGTVADDLSFATPYTWSQPTTENPSLNSTEIWEIYNFTADAHPVHLHLVNFQILDRFDFEYDVNGVVDVPMHNGEEGQAPNVENIRNLTPTGVGSEYFESAPKDMVSSLPGDPEPEEGPPTGQMVRIRATFDRPGRYVWHCHILSHEDHEMMRVLHVGGGA